MKNKLKKLLALALFDLGCVIGRLGLRLEGAAPTLIDFTRFQQKREREQLKAILDERPYEP